MRQPSYTLYRAQFLHFVANCRAEWSTAVRKQVQTALAVYQWRIPPQRCLPLQQHFSVINSICGTREWRVPQQCHLIRCNSTCSISGEFPSGVILPAATALAASVESSPAVSSYPLQQHLQHQWRVPQRCHVTHCNNTYGPNGQSGSRALAAPAYLLYLSSRWFFSLQRPGQSVFFYSWHRVEVNYARCSQQSPGVIHLNKVSLIRDSLCAWWWGRRRQKPPAPPQL